MVLGAPFSGVGVYIDNVFVRQPFHGISGDPAGASIGVVNDDLIDSVSLTPLGYSQQYEDAVGGALDIRTREGNRDKTSVTVGVGMAESHATAEGGLAKNRVSWLLSARKSYLAYLVHHATDDTAIEPSFSDISAKLVYSIVPHQTLDFLEIGGTSNVEDSSSQQADINSLFSGNSKFNLTRLGWRAALASNLLLSTQAAFVTQSERTQNQQRSPLGQLNNSEWSTGTTLTWDWKPKQTLQAGWTFRRLSGVSKEYGYFYYATPDDPQNSQLGISAELSSGTGTRQGAYVQQSSTALHGRLQIMGGARWDTMSSVEANPFSPQISGSFRILSGTSLFAGAGRYLQFPEVQDTSVACGYIAPVDLRTDQYLAGIDQRLSDNTRIRFQAFRRYETQEQGFRGGLLSYGDTSCGGVVADSEALPPTRVTTQGAQIILQRRSANRLSGWISYTLLHQREVMTSSIGGPDGYQHIGSPRH